MHGQSTIPAKNKSSTIYIRAPHCKALRPFYDPGEYILNPATRALSIIGKTPQQQLILKRLESYIKNDEFVKYFNFKGAFCDEEIFCIRRQLTPILHNIMENGKYIYPSSNIGLFECIVQELLQPDDFTYEQRLKIFDTYVEEILNKMQIAYYQKNTRQYAWIDDHDSLCLVNKRFSLKEWEKFGHKEFEAILDQTTTDLNLIFDISRYDWNPLSIILGNDIEMFTALKSATLRAEFEASQNIFKIEYGNFLKLINEASRLGTMRKNNMHFNSIIMKRLGISIYINDIGNGAKVMHHLNDSFESLFRPIQSIADFFR